MEGRLRLEGRRRPATGRVQSNASIRGDGSAYRGPPVAMP